MTTLGLQNFQGTYDASVSLPHVTVNAANGPVTIRDNATPIGDIFVIEDNAGTHILSADPDQIDFGPVGNRTMTVIAQPSGRGGINYLPDGRTVTAVPTQVAFLQWDSTVTTNIPGGAPFGNDTAPAMVASVGTAIFADAGNLFASSLLFNQGTNLQLQANIGPVYTMVNQPQWIADGGSFSSSQHNALRIQPRWGPNINAGSITQTSAVFILNTAFVDATVGSATVTSMTYWLASNPTLTAGGTIGTFVAIDIDAITGPSSITGIRSAMSSGTFISHTGTAPSSFNGSVTITNTTSLLIGSTTPVTVTRSAASTIRFLGVANSSVNLALTTANRAVIGTTTVSALQVNTPEVSLGTTAPVGVADNWFLAIAAPAKASITLAGDFSNCLNSAGGSHTINAALTNFTQWTINAPAGTLGGGGSVTNSANVLIQTSPGVGLNRYGLLVTTNPTGGTLNYCARFQGAAGVRVDGIFQHTGTTVGIYNATPVVQHSTTGQTAGFTAGAGTSANDDSTFTGGVGATAYTIGDVVRALKNIGVMTA